MKTVSFRDMDPNGHYSPCVISNGMLYISGMLSMDPITKKVPEPNIEAHMLQALANVDRVLIAAGLTRSNVVFCRIYVSDISYWDKINEIYAQHFGNHRPGRIIVPLNGRLHFGCLVEIEAIAEIEPEECKESG